MHLLGQILVPAETGTPSDLPRWACKELVDYRAERLAETLFTVTAPRRDRHGFWVRDVAPDRSALDAAHAYLGSDDGACPDR